MAPRKRRASVAASAKRKKEEPEPEAVEEEQVEAPAAKRQRRGAPRELEAVQHPSHGKEPGSLFVWGTGDCGQLGLGEDVTEKYRPFLLEIEGKQVVQAACGGMHTAVVTSDGLLFTWGVNDEGALGRETAGELWAKSPRAAGKPSDPYVPGAVAMPSEAQPIVQVSAGDSHTAVLTKDGQVYAWGTFRDASGVFGFSPGCRIQLVPQRVVTAATPAEQVVRISSGADHVAALRADGSVLTWGSGAQGQLGRVGPMIPSRKKETLLLVPQPVHFRRLTKDRIVDVVCAPYGTAVLTHQGKLFVCGLNQYGQLGLESQEMRFGEPVAVAALADTPVAGVSSGQHHCLVLLQDGRVLAFGRPTYGRLGRSDVDTASDAAQPKPGPVDGVPDGATVTGVAAGGEVSACFGTEPSGKTGLWLWGMGTNYQLARGDEDDDVNTPSRIQETKRFNAQKVLMVSFGGQHAVALTVPLDVPLEEVAEPSKGVAKGKRSKKTAEPSKQAAKSSKKAGKAAAPGQDNGKSEADATETQEPDANSTPPDS